MKIMTIKELEQLSAVKGAHCISIYIPTHRGGKEVMDNEDGRTLKSLAQKVKLQLLDRGMNDNEAMTYLKPILDLVEDSAFWRNQLEGLAVFLSGDFFRYYRMPFSFQEFSLITDSFHLKPLAPAFSDDDYYYILAISLHHVRMFEAGKFGIHELNLKDLFPENVDEILSYYQFEQSLQMRSKHGGMNSGDNVQYFGQGGSKQDITPYIKEYFREIDKGVSRLMTSRRIPLVLAGVDYLHPIYKDANTQAHIVEKGIMGNPDEMKAKEIHEKSLEIMEPYFVVQREKRKDKYQRLAGTGKTSYDISEIVNAARIGRVEALFAARESNIWGKIKSDNGGDVELHDHFQPNDHCLIDVSAVSTLLNGGELYLVEKENLPEENADTNVAAVFRY